MCNSEALSFVNRCFFNNEPIILCLTYFYFHGAVLKIIWKDTCCQNGSQTETSIGYSKVTAAVLISHFQRATYCHFYENKDNEEYQVIF